MGRGYTLHYTEISESYHSSDCFSYCMFNYARGVVLLLCISLMVIIMVACRSQPHRLKYLNNVRGFWNLRGIPYSLWPFWYLGWEGSERDGWIIGLVNQTISPPYL